MQSQTHSSQCGNTSEKALRRCLESPEKVMENWWIYEHKQISESMKK